MKNLGSKRLETDRLILKTQTMEEQKYLWSILMIPDVNRYYLTVPTYLRNKLKDWNIQKQYYEEDMKHSNDLDVYRWSIFLKDTNECIGRVSCHKAKFEDETINDSSIRGVGWYIDPKYQGLGYGKEAAKTMIDFMFNQVGINAIKSGACVNNPASWKIYEGLGFKRLDKTKMIQYTYLDELSEAYDYILTKEMYKNQNKK